MTAPTGLTAAEVAERVRLGHTNAEGTPSSRSVGEIVRRNVFTFFNGLLFVLLVAILLFGQLRDALFGFVLFLNMAIGIVQELRAKRTLDKLSLIAAPMVRAVRDAVMVDIPVAGVVLDDVIEVRAGDQIVADGTVMSAASFEVDESLLTGESRPVYKSAGDRVMSGSFCVAGNGRMVARGVGADSYAQRLAAEAKRFHKVPSELRRGTDLILKTIAVVLIPTAVLLIVSRLNLMPDNTAALVFHLQAMGPHLNDALLHLRDIGPNLSAAASHLVDALPYLREIVPQTVAALVGMVPNGLVLLTSIAFAVSVIRLASRRALIQELPAVEILARVDVVCLDKTGTITEPEFEVQGLSLAEGADEASVRGALACLAAIEPADTRNATARALAAAYGEAPQASTQQVPFSSARKWSGACVGDGGAWVLGAPDILLAEGDPLRARASKSALAGARVLVVARVAALPAPGEPLGPLDAQALVMLAERIRDDATATLAYFREQGVALKVISGDSPVTVASVAARAGLEIVGDPVDASQLPKDQAALAEFMEAHTVFGRVRPEDKRDMVAALQSRGHVVAMTGDGVNDVLALKTADLGIAMGGGAPAARAVADLVLLDGKFSSLPGVVAEGRRVIANVERVANLFVTKSVYAALLAFWTVAFAVHYPLMPRHFTLIDALTIGIPGFFLALAPAAPRYRPGFLKRVLRFTLVCGSVMTVAAASAYWWGLQNPTVGAGIDEARTMAVWTLLFVGLWVLVELSRPLNRMRAMVVASMAAIATAIVFLPFAREFFALPEAPQGATLAIGAAVAASVLAIDLLLRAVGWRPDCVDESRE